MVGPLPLRGAWRVLVGVGAHGGAEQDEQGLALLLHPLQPRGDRGRVEVVDQLDGVVREGRWSVHTPTIRGHPARVYSACLSAAYRLAYSPSGASTTLAK